MLIGLAGRKSSGKTTLANIILQKGFKKASFAAGLKEYVGTLYNWTLDDLNSQTGKESLLSSPVAWDEKKCDQLSKLTGMNLKFIEPVCFPTRREALQYIGTDVLRKHDPHFHLNEFKKRYSVGDFICDDLRFPNELKMVEEIGAISCYILRPYYWDYTNHSSETALNYNQFDYVIMNDSSQESLVKTFKPFAEKILSANSQEYKKIKFDRTTIVKTLKSNNYNLKFTSKILGCGVDKLNELISTYLIFVPKNKSIINHESFCIPTKENSFWASYISINGAIKKNPKYQYVINIKDDNFDRILEFKKFIKTNIPVFKKNDKWEMTIYSPYIIHDLKLWNIKPTKEKQTKIPCCIKDNKEFLGEWLHAMISMKSGIHSIVS